MYDNYTFTWLQTKCSIDIDPRQFFKSNFLDLGKRRFNSVVLWCSVVFSSLAALKANQDQRVKHFRGLHNQKPYFPCCSEHITQ